MNLPTPPPLPVEDPQWSDMLKSSYAFDQVEVGSKHHLNRGYSGLYQARRTATLQALSHFAPPPGKLLDLAGAGGNFAIAAAQMGYQVTWNDLRDDLADYVRLKAPAQADIAYVPGNIFDLGIDYHAAFDVVLALEVIEHVAHPDAMMAQLAKLVRPGGIILISTPNGAYLANDLPRFSDFPDPSVFEGQQFRPDSDGHIFLLYEDEMRRFAEECGLELVSYEQFASVLTAGHFKTRHLLRWLPEAATAGLERAARSLPKAVRQHILSGSLTVCRKL